MRKTDRNQAEIVAGLRKVGASVQDLSMVGKGCPDLLVGYFGATYLLEVKSAKGKEQPSQVRWRTRWRGRYPTIVRDLEEALVAIRAIKAYT